MNDDVPISSHWFHPLSLPPGGFFRFPLLFLNGNVRFLQIHIEKPKKLSILHLKYKKIKNKIK